MNRLVCRVLNHRWVALWTPRGKDRGLPALVCTRCRENGWVA